MSSLASLSTRQVAGAKQRSIAELLKGIFSGGSDLGTQVRAILAKYSPNAHVYLPHIGVLSGLTAGNYLDSVGTTAATVDNPVGKVDDAAGAIDVTQATTANKPILSQRYNLLTKTEDFSDAAWTVDIGGTGSVIKTLGQVDPIGGTTAARLQFTSGGGNGASLRYSIELATNQCIRSFYIKSNTGLGYTLILGDTSITIAADTAWHRYFVSENVFSWGTRIQNFSGNADITVAFPQKELGTILGPYQRVNTATDYDHDVSKFKYHWKFDASDSFTSGACTLPADADVFIGLSTYNALPALVIDSGPDEYLGAMMSGNTALTSANAGSPSYAVNGIDVAGGVSTTRAQLFSAVTLAANAVLEVRDANLSTWSMFRLGGYTGFELIGHVSILIIIPAMTSEERTIVRKFCAQLSGVTL